MSRYLFLAVGWRGRPTPKPNRSAKLTFCGPCGDLLIDRMWPTLPRDVSYLRGVEPMQCARRA